jgi:hypothetical protein
MHPRCDCGQVAHVVAARHAPGRGATFRALCARCAERARTRRPTLRDRGAAERAAWRRRLGLAR